jgi:SAM-dependent methyltransferase
VTDPKQIVREGYERLGSKYWEWSRDNDPQFRERYVDLALSALAPGSRVVELGSGSGKPTAEWLTERFDTICIDVALSQLALVGHNAPVARRVCADFSSLSFGPGSIDAVVAFYSIIHLPRDEHAGVFANIATWLRPEGIFVGCMGARVDEGTAEDWIDDIPMYWSSYGADAELELIANAGLEIVRTEELANFEDGREARFLWFIARRPA